MNYDLGLLRAFGNDLDFRLHRPSWRNEREGSDPYLVAPTLRDVLIANNLKIRNKEGELIALKLNRAQQEYSRTCTQRNIVLKARQLGITTYVAARFFVQTISRPGTLTVQVAHNQESAEEIFHIVRRFWENLPKAMREGAVVTSRANIRQMIFPRLDSEYRVASAADENAGRGLTIRNLHCSEVARWPRGGIEALSSLRAAVPRSSGEIVLESTPRGAGGVFYEEWQRANETGYTRHFYPWWYEENYRLPAGQDGISVHPLTPEEEALVERWSLTDEQIAFRRACRAAMRGLAAQEYAEDAVSCFLASGECVFDVEVIQNRLVHCGEPIDMRDNGRLMFWWPYQTPRQYIIGVDPAGGGSEGDFACAEVIDRSTGLQCAELHGHFPPRELALKVVELAELYGRALVAVERNNHGYGVLAHLRREGYPNLYEQDGKDGWLTSAVSRPAMIENLVAALASAPQLFQSPRLVSEFRTFVRHADGSCGALTGTHDDCVMAMAIAWAVRAAVAGERSRMARLELATLT